MLDAERAVFRGRASDGLHESQDIRPLGYPNHEGGPPFLGGDFAVAEAGAFAVPTAGGKKGRHLRFLPSLNTRFPWWHSLGADGRLRKQEKGNGREFFLPHGIRLFAVSDTVLLHRPDNQRRARHNSAAQIFYPCRLSKSCGCRRYALVIVLRGTVMPRLRSLNRLRSRKISDIAKR